LREEDASHASIHCILLYEMILPTHYTNASVAQARYLS